MSTPTPRTDANAGCLIDSEEVVPADFARTLERELATERARLEKIKTLLTASNTKLALTFGELTAGESRTVRAVLNHVVSIH